MTIEINQFIEKFAAEFEETPIEELVPSVNFKDLDEWGSLLALSIIGMIDDEYEVSVTGDDMRKAITIEDLYNIVKSRL